jgi:hypothetical protein
MTYACMGQWGCMMRGMGVGSGNKTKVKKKGLEKLKEN